MCNFAPIGGMDFFNQVKSSNYDSVMSLEVLVDGTGVISQVQKCPRFLGDIPNRFEHPVVSGQVVHVTDRPKYVNYF